MPTNLFQNPPAQQQATPKNLFEGADQLNLAQPTPESQGAVKQPNGTYKAPSFLEGLKQAAIGAGNYFGSEAVGLGKVVSNALKPSSNTFLPQNRDANKNVAKDAPYNQAIQFGTDLQNQMSPQNQAQQGGATAANVAEIALPLAKPISGIIENAPKILESGKNLIGNIVKGSPKTEEQVIQDLISPKPTVSQAKLAESQGRLIKGQEPTLFKAGTEDVVLPSQKNIRAAQTIQNNIPGAAKMNEAQLYTSLNNKTGEIAMNLKPEMLKVSVNPEVSSKIGSAWQDLKQIQISDVPATEEANVAKLQGKFDQILQKLGKTENPTMQNYWDARQSYDQSIKDAVKKANNLSPESLQMQKEIWLQNREILNGAINDSSTGLGQTSKQSFSDMTDMYNAKEGILSKAKINTKVQPSKIVQWVKKHPIISTIVGATVLNKAGGGVPAKIAKSALGL
jgi:hypothetical protein